MRNAKNLFALLLYLGLTLINCGSSGQMIPAPQEKMNLLIGSLIFDINGYQDNFTTIRKNIDVAIIGRYVKEGRSHNFGQWVTTDEDGYFYLLNVPDGEYAIKGFRLRVIGIGNINISNELLDLERNYFELTNQDMISLTGELFDTRAQNRIINFQHNLFTLYPNGIVRFKRYDRIQDEKLATGEIISSPPVVYYFIDKFETTEWEGILNMHLK